MAPTLPVDDREFVIELAKRIIPIKAISPFSGGEGESRRVDELEKILLELGLSKFERYDTTDDRGVTRSNLVCRVGSLERTLWIVAHVDTVPEGDINLWTHPPFKATVEGSRIYGRGSADDLQAVFTSFLLLRKADPSKMKYNLGIAFVADEEMGSKYGIQYLLGKNIFNKDDLFIVPDWGVPDSLQIEVAEKSILWLRFTVLGKQGHASTPDEAVNATREGMRFMLELEKRLNEKYTEIEPLFNPPNSTFQITMHGANVSNINTIPGKDDFCLDSRILPMYDLDMVLDEIESTIRSFESTSKARIKLDVIQKEQSPHATSSESEIVKGLVGAIKNVKGNEPKLIGIGGGTCAAFFRHHGMDAVVWSTANNEVYHQADEYCVIDHVLGDAEIISEMLRK